MEVKKPTEYSKKDLDFFEIMDGMEEVNREMADKIDEKLREEQPICHFTKMEYEDGFWFCKHCSHEVESEVCPPEQEYNY